MCHLPSQDVVIGRTSSCRTKLGSKVHPSKADDVAEFSQIDRPGQVRLDIVEDALQSPFRKRRGFIRCKSSTPHRVKREKARSQRYAYAIDKGRSGWTSIIIDLCQQARQLKDNGIRHEMRIKELDWTRGRTSINFSKTIGKKWMRQINSNAIEWFCENGAAWFCRSRY